VQFDLAYLIGVMPALIRATGITLVAAVCGMVVALIIGLPLALLLMSRVRLVAETTKFLVEAVRLTPLLVQLYFVFYVLPLYGVTLPALATGIGMLGLHYATYTCEIYRAGFMAVPRHQWEAAIALNMRPTRTLRAIIFPQAAVPMIPAFGNYLISILKETPLLSAITVPELVATGKKISFFTFKYVEIFTAIGLIFLVLSYAGALCVRYVEKKTRLPR
jgi:polar amino acid transport system permease protein